MKVLEEAKKTTNRAAGRKFGVDEASVRYWKQQENELSKLSGGKRLPGAGRKVKLPDMEELLAAWIFELRSKNVRITRSAIQTKALELHTGEEDFSASRGWLEKFFRRHNFTLRRRTTVAQRLPQDLVSKVTSYIIRVRKMRSLQQYQLSLIGNMDETVLVIFRHFSQKSK